MNKNEATLEERAVNRMNTDQHCAYVSREGKHKCQFEEAHDFIELDGKLWCRFHLPMRDGQGNDSSKAIWDGPTIEAFNHAIFDLIGNAKTQNTKADFEGVVFPGAISFEQFTADNPLPEVSFFRAAFSGHAGFERATFSGNARFERTTFSDHAWFVGATFSENARFFEATFSGDAAFNGATFSGRAWFKGATFSDHADFRGATFSGYAWFVGAKFSGEARFVGATFSGEADFSCSPNRPGPSPNNNLQRDSFATVSFENAKFNGPAIFTNRTFTHPADFSGGHFKLAPEFYGCLLHQGTTFLGRKFLDRGKENVRAVMAYRTLKITP